MITNSSSPSQTPDSQITAFTVEFQGPLPSPNMLAEFDRVVPGLARKIVDRSEIDLQHRHQMEMQALTARIHDRKTMYAARRQSQWMAFILAIVFSSFGVYLVVNGHPKTGGTMATVTVVALVGVFLTGQLIRPKQSTPEQEETES